MSELQMREYPIIFSSPMVRAILDGRKTQTRRLASALWLNRLCRQIADNEGMRLWVREAWNLYHEDEDEGPERCVIQYRADDDIVQLIPLRYSALEEFVAHEFNEPRFEAAKALAQRWRETWTEVEGWRPSIHMPRWASRITLDVVSMRKETLQDISDEDAFAEGANSVLPIGERQRDDFAWVWDSLRRKPGTTWADNPEVYRIEFRVSDKVTDAPATPLASKEDGR